MTTSPHRYRYASRDCGGLLGESAADPRMGVRACTGGGSPRIPLHLAVDRSGRFDAETLHAVATLVRWPWHAVRAMRYAQRIESADTIRLERAA